MTYKNHFNRLLIPVVCAVLFCLNAPVLVAQVAIESGQWCEDNISSDWWYGHWWGQNYATYTFFAQPNETVIIRLCHDEDYDEPIFAMYNPGPDGNISTTTNNPATWTSIGANEHYLAVTNYGWYKFVCSLPIPVITNTWTNAYSSFNCSILRVPHIPLSYQDTDVGTLPIGDSKLGEINVSSDLDAGFFAVANTPTTMQIRMGQLDYAQVPKIQIYDPNGARLTNDFPTDYRSEITATLTNPGIYTVVCSDQFTSKGKYALTMVQIPGTLSGSDTDIGMIISGQKKTGTINQPGDLDLAWFGAVSGDMVNITMQDVDLDFNPVLEFYSPTGARLARTTDIFETCAVITNFRITSNGVYSVICKDKEDRKDVSYTLQMNFQPGSPSFTNFPGAPASISASQGSYSNCIEVKWSVGSGAISYDLWRSYGTNIPVIITNIPWITYIDYDVITNVNYSYKVQSCNTYGASTNFSPSALGFCGSSAAASKRNVLLVGIDNYAASYGPSSLTTCTNDAVGMRDIFFLGDPSNRWASTNIVMYTDRQATKSTIQGALQSLASASSAGDIVVYAHSSHGGTAGTNTFLCTYDANYTAAELAVNLNSFNPATIIIVILDACYSGGMYRFKDAPPPPWPFAEETMAHYRQIKTAQLQKQGLAVPKELGANIAFMTACDYDELSYTSSFYSRYMGYLINGCNVQSVDTNNSGQYNFLELHNYAATQSMAETPSQHAQSYHPSVLNENIARAVGTNNQSFISRIRYNDFDGDAFSDIAIYNTANGAWRIGSLHRWVVLAWDAVWGGPAYRPINGDYDGDRATDLAVYSESQGSWSIASLKRMAVIVPSASFGGPSLTPVSGDYNGDGIYDGALYQDPEGFWYVISSVGAPLLWGATLTGTGFVPVSGDYDGDFKSDLAMYSASSGYWYIMSMTGATITWGTSWGVANATPVSGDFDGDGYSDLAVYQESTGLWYIWSLKRSATIANALYFGGPGFLPVPGDYDGDGSCDLVVYQESTGKWHLRTVSGSPSGVITFGGPGYIPVLPAW